MNPQRFIYTFDPMRNYTLDTGPSADRRNENPLAFMKNRFDHSRAPAQKSRL